MDSAGSTDLTGLTDSIDSAEGAGTAALDSVSDSAVGAGAGPGWVSGSGIPSGIARGGDLDPHTDMAITGIRTATSMVILIRETTLRTITQRPLRRRTINTIVTIREAQMAIG